MYDSIIVGGGMAGLTSAAYLAKAGRKVLLLEKEAYVGGLVNSFKYDGFTIDGGIRSMENSGILFPMLKELGINIPFERSIVTVGIKDDLVEITGKESLKEYSELLKKHFPANKRDIDEIIDDIKTIMKYMDILYGLDNPLFMDLMKDKKYLFNTVLPWSFKFLFTIPKVNNLNEPVEEYLKRFTDNQRLIDTIAQHFFKQTPAFFAMSYFSLYLDYYYPKGGTNTLPLEMEKFILKHGGEIKKRTEVVSVNSKNRTLEMKDGSIIKYKKLVWAADQKLLYKLSDHPHYETIKNLKGGDSVFSLYTTVNIKPEALPGTGHFFYTPTSKGIGDIEKILPTMETKEDIKQWIKDYLKNNTFEIAIPAKRDSSLAPAGQCGLIISTLFDYNLTKKINDMGWYKEFKVFIEDEILNILNQSIYKGIKDHVLNKRSSTPLTIQKYTNNTDGAITGWSFENDFIPSIKNMIKVSKSVHTKIKHIYQAGQWSFSPSGLPISILTGKLAANEVIKDTKRLL